MSNLKNFTRIWNPILEALAKARLTQNQYKICLALFQNTYTWHRTEAHLSYRVIEQCTGIRANKVGQPFRQLIDAHIIIEIKEPSFSAPGLYSFNKDIREWSEKVLDISEISDTNIQIVAAECSETVPVKGGTPQNGDCPQDKGEGTPHHGGEGSPQNGESQDHLSPWGATDTEPLKKGLKKYKEISTTATANAHGDGNIYQSFQQEFGRPLSPIEVDTIQDWVGRYSPDLVAEALKRAVLQGALSMKYIGGILLDWHKCNVRTLLEVRRQDQEFEKRKGVEKRGATRSTRKPRGDPAKDGGPNSTGQGDSIDYTRFEFQG